MFSPYLRKAVESVGGVLGYHRFRRLDQRTQDRVRRMAAFGFAAYLLAAACLKGYSVLTGPAQPFLYILSPRWEVFLIEYEIALALWLISATYARAAWITALLTFHVFAAASLVLGILGRPSCGCFGNWIVNPWYVFVADVAAIAALWCLRPPALALFHRSPALHARKPRLIHARYASAVALSALCVTVFAPYLSGVAARLGGRSLSVNPEVTYLGR